jgi:hypothetical protein
MEETMYNYPEPEETLDEAYERLQKQLRREQAQNAKLEKTIARLLAMPAQGEQTTSSQPTTDQPTQQPKSPRKKTGRPPKTEQDAATKVLSALCRHHGYELGGSVTNPEPATNRGLAALYNQGLAGRDRMGDNALARFLKAKFAKDGRSGHKHYRTACRQGRIGARLALWRGELPSHMPDLPKEDGRGKDDND